ncbi:hypothetical protein JGI3_00120 [Candidatus Kryptobacter tengchongensis]|uniref:Uncharacterized protein n=1 Tax=Kryptobacter tengchongensis TaxID=1643429 RepID=A0A656CYH8_KRYT1|nr:hypothetical protein [Candidatus Kryptobacter tengchongensis]CUS87487.1 hypothetical protein JGI20_00204 [Candidatus Kryptobacter tengchongensis]CUS98831.1 hypothetical protein JGI24_00510 [Candidatus Kryptobacter tengchongensis]CUT01411.1 hypothetical protein JGI25_00885 [Candidatus Kryptobacter tengchongensis]CUU09537.1 hypothetical protein JGI3_00120 [Candidatus Kryptobacter tengchongensis]
MTTKAPSSVKEFPSDSLEKIAYSSVEGIPAEEPNDLNRLGYHIWLYLTGKIDSLEIAVKMARARLNIPEEEAIKIIRMRLKERGI